MLKVPPFSPQYGVFGTGCYPPNRSLVKNTTTASPENCEKQRHVPVSAFINDIQTGLSQITICAYSSGTINLEVSTMIATPTLESQEGFFIFSFLVLHISLVLCLNFLSPFMFHCLPLFPTYISQAPISFFGCL